MLQTADVLMRETGIYLINAGKAFAHQRLAEWTYISDELGKDYLDKSSINQ